MTAGGGSLTLAGLGCSPLWLAAGYDRIACLEYLIHKLREYDQLESSLLHDANDVGDTPFLAAASRGNIEACKCLLRSVEECRETTAANGRQPRCRGDDDEDYDCNLHQCSRWRRMKARIIRTTNRVGDTPLQVAVASGHIELVTLLLEVDDLCHDTAHDGDDTVEEEEYSKKCVDRKNESGLSPLIVACERNLPSIVRTLLEHGADLHARDARGRSALAVAAFCGCIDVVEYLLDCLDSTTDGTSSSLLNAPDRDGKTPLLLAARTGNLKMTKLLVDAGADARIRDHGSLTLLDVAVKFKKENVIEYLSSCTPSSTTEITDIIVTSS
ncbi:hypothetical protein ACHAW5_004631 [Stephanodiscus triporus]|uniref:Uncharacterized protein n=1 Tax=Stephanodiscus triporus TaxID=2934178 RepID=A0ABD3MM71_9STRA